jgi:hypothetical protein
VSSEKKHGCIFQSPAVQRVRVMVRETGPKGQGNRRTVQIIVVGLGTRAVASVKSRRGLFRSTDPNILREKRVQSLEESLWRNRQVEMEMRNLGLRVDAGVRSARSDEADGMAGHTF